MKRDLISSIAAVASLVIDHTWKIMSSIATYPRYPLAWSVSSLGMASKITCRRNRSGYKYPYEEEGIPFGVTRATKEGEG